MKFLNPKVHGIIDYLAVIIFAIAPAILHMTGAAATLSYVYAVAVLGLSLLTRYPLGVVKVVPFPVHGGIELVASIFALVSPWLFKFASIKAERNFFVVMGIVVLALWLFTNYKATLPAEERAGRAEREAAGSAR